VTRPFSSTQVNTSKVNSIKDLNLDYRNSYLGKDLTNTGRSINFFGQVNYKISNSITSNTNFSTSSSYSNGFMPYLYFMGDSAEICIEVTNLRETAEKDLLIFNRTLMAISKSEFKKQSCFRF
jgi:hypothetical protein